MIAWWETEQPGKEARVVLIQFDLAGHSKWVEGQPQHIIPVAKSRAEFAKTLATLLAYEGFYPLFWLGDGGVFARRYSGEEDADTAVKAADGALKYFERFNKDTQNPQMLSLRTTATVANVILDPESSHWLSPELNEFLKYERDLGMPEAFVITPALYNRLSEDKKRRFPPTRCRQVLLANNSEITVYVDSSHPGRLVDSGPNFEPWLRERRVQVCFPKPTYKTPDGLGTSIPIGDAVLIDWANRNDGYWRVRLLQTAFPQDTGQLS